MTSSIYSFCNVFFWIFKSAKEQEEEFKLIFKKMAQETSGIVETYTSCYDWHIENAVEWKEAAKSSDFRLKSDKIKIENFPMKWWVKVAN